MDKIKLIDDRQLRKDMPQFNVGDEVKVFVRIPEADKIRIHPFEGIVIRKRAGGMGSTFTVRKISFGESVERTFPTNSPTIEKMELIKKGKVKRARLYYLRERFGKSARIQEDTNLSR